MRPTKVKVHWSESGEFVDGEEMPFDTFERRAFRVAFKNVDDGYLKTSITVFFDDEDASEYTMRLDLAKHDELGFRHAVEQRLAHARTPDGQKLCEKMPSWGKAMAFLSQVEFD